MAEDSKVHFKDVCTRLGLASVLPFMETKGWDTIGTFAFSSSYSPGHATDEAFMAGVVDRLCLERESPLVPALRRLFFEAYTQAAMEMRRCGLSYLSEKLAEGSGVSGVT